MTVLNECFRRAKEITLAKWSRILRLIRSGRYSRARHEMTLGHCAFCILDDMVAEFLGGFGDGWCNYCVVRDLCDSPIYHDTRVHVAFLEDLSREHVIDLVKGLEILLVQVAAIPEFRSK